MAACTTVGRCPKHLFVTATALTQKGGTGNAISAIEAARRRGARYDVVVLGESVHATTNGSDCVHTSWLDPRTSSDGL